MRVVITGGAGFVGSHLVERYLRDGHEVVAIDNLCTGSLRNLDDASESTRLTFVRADAALPLPVRGTVDLVLHFASPASPVDYARLALETLAVNSIGTAHACDLAERHGARLLFASTSEVYGDPLVHPQPESYWGNVNPAGERACYDEAKRFGEALITTRLRKGPLDARIVRIFNTYGPRMAENDGRAVPNFFAQALAGKPLTVYGDGNQTRSFTYVDDLVEGVVRRAAHPDDRGLRCDHRRSRGRNVSRRAPAVAARRSGAPQTRHHPRPYAAGLGTRHAPARGDRAHAGVVAQRARLLDVALDGLRVAHRRAVRIGAGVAQPLALVQQIVETVELYGDLRQPSAPRRIEAAAFTALPQLVLLGNQRLNRLMNRCVAHKTLLPRYGFGDGFADVDRVGGAADVARARAAREDFFDRLDDGRSRFGIAEMLEHHRARPDLTDRVGHAFARNVGRRAVNGFEHRGILAFGVEVRRRRDADRADDRRAEIGEDVTK
jgi:nucleoside-diphosphate-sugar epimerase